MQEHFDVERFLVELSKVNEKSIIEADSFTKIDRLCKKVDVVKKVYKFYTQDLAKKSTELEISEKSYIALLELLMRISGIALDFKFLNTSLKLNEILLKKNIISSESATINFDRLEKLMLISYESLMTQS